MLDRPVGRTADLVSERVGDELVVYDARTQMAHSLSATATSVWTHCDGSATSAEIAIRCGLSPELAARAIAELGEKDLLERAPGISRRDAAKRFAQVGGAAFAAPVIYSVAVGPATAAASTCTTNGTGVAQPSTATCSAAAGTLGTSSGPGHCCGQCYNNSGSFTCPPSGCLPATSASTVASQCCSGALNGGGNHCV